MGRTHTAVVKFVEDDDYRKGWRNASSNTVQECSCSQKSGRAEHSEKQNAVNKRTLTKMLVLEKGQKRV